MKNTLKIPNNLGLKDGNLSVMACIHLSYLALEEAQELALESI